MSEGVFHMSNKKRENVGESAKTRRIRQKLEKQLSEYEQQVTPQAIERKTIEIHRWIARHAPERIALKDKNISLFDENQNAASLSRRVSDLVENLYQT